MEQQEFAIPKGRSGCFRITLFAIRILRVCPHATSPMNINGSSSNGFPHAAVKQEQESAVTELPEIQHDLLPFGVLVERVAGQAYADLHNLTEVFVARFLLPAVEYRHVLSISPTSGYLLLPMLSENVSCWTMYQTLADVLCGWPSSLVGHRTLKLCESAW